VERKFSGARSWSSSCWPLVGTVWGATQWTAAALGYQPELGPPWFMVGTMARLSAARLLLVVVQLRRLCAARSSLPGAFIAAGGGIAAVVVAIGMSVWRARERKRGRNLWLGALGDAGEVAAAGCSVRTASCSAGWQSALSSPRRPRACPVLRADPIGQGRGPGRADAADLARLGIVHDIKGENWR
jgi:type IV secretion system protein VirD4